MSEASFADLVGDEPPGPAGMNNLFDIGDRAGASPRDSAMIHGTTPIVRFDRTGAALSDLRGRYEGTTFDLTTTAGDKAARAARLELVTLRTTLEKTRKEFKAPAIAFGELIDSEAKRITAAILALEKPIDEQIKADEARRAAEKAERERANAERIAKHEAGIAAIRSYVSKASGLASSRIAIGIETLEKMVFTEADWQEFAVPAANAQCETLEALRTLHAQTLGREQEARRQDEIRQENERQAAINAAEAKRISDEAAALRAEAAASTARLDAERAEFMRQREAARVEDERKKALEAAAAAPAPTPQAEPEPAATAAAAPPPVNPEPPAPAAASAEPTLSISAINARIGDGFGMTAAFIQTTLGVSGTKAGKSVLYTEPQWGSIKRRLAKHLEALV